MSEHDELPERDGGAKIIPTKSLLKLCAILFEEFCQEREISEEHVATVSPVPFLAWFREKNVITVAESVQDYCARAEAGEVVWHALADLAHDSMGANQLQTIWHAVTLGNRPDPKDRLDSIHVIALLKWTDGRAMPLSSYVPRELVNSSHKFNDGIACTTIQMQAASLVEALRQIGLNDAHDFRSQIADEEAFEVVMGILLKILMGAAIIDPQTGQHVKLGKELMDRCQNVQRLLQAMYRPPLPPEIRQQIEAKRAEERAQEERQKPSASPLILPGQSGWEEP